MPAASPSRLFFGLAVPAEVRAMAGRVQEQVRASLPMTRFPALEGLHITLAFLGQTDSALIPALLALAQAAGQGPGFSLRTGAVGGFPRPEHSRILWLGFEPEPALDAMAGRLRAGLRASRVPFDEKAFMPHLTLARFRETVDLGRIALSRPPAAAFSVAGITLFRSVSAPHGTAYQAIR